MATPSFSLITLVLLALGSPAQVQPQQGQAEPARNFPNELRVEVLPQLELVTLAARMAGFEEFRQPNSDSSYSRAIEAHFAHLRDHPVLALLVELRRERGVSYDALASLAVHLGPLPELAERVPFESAPERLDPRWGDRAQVFVEQLRDFARKGNAPEFFAGRRAYFAEVEARLRERLAPSPARPWFDAFFGVRAGASYVAVPGLLCGGGNFGVGLRLGAGEGEEITPVFGCWEFDAEGLPIFGAAYLPLFVHELCHSYTNPLADRHAETLEPLGQRLFALRSSQMQRQAYTGGRTVLYETLVRACVVRCRADTEGYAAGIEQAAYELGTGFTWVPALAGALHEYQAERERFPTLDDFVPRIAEVLGAELVALEAALELAPRLVGSLPANGAADVDPALTELSFSFDRPMLDQSWSIVGSSAEVPAIQGSPRYDAERRVLSLPVRLEAGRSYRLSLNSAARRGFQSAEGVALEPVHFEFSTRP